jgi:cytochrome b
LEIRVVLSGREEKDAEAFCMKNTDDGPPFGGSADAGPSSADIVPIWDLPTRVCHWLFVVLIAACWWTARNDDLNLHIDFGYGLLALLVFRIYWGLVGSHTARFSSFVKGPRTVWRYVASLSREDRVSFIGHNPLGAISVVALLSLMLAQVVLGLFSVDIDGIESGPLSQYVSFELGRTFARWHIIGFNVLKALIVIHIAAIGFYLFNRRENLTMPMLVGHKRIPGYVGESKPRPRYLRLLVGAILSAIVTWAVARGLRL